MFVISVIIPVYNVEKYVYRCLNSVIMQLENDIEIIIVNDGSTDNSVKICENAISNLPSKQIKLITQKNFGLSSARNRGIKEATGKYVMFLDSDDELKPEALKILKKSIKEKPDVDVFYYDAVVQDEITDGKRRNGYDRKKKVPPNIKINSNEYFIEYYVDTLIVSACLCLIKKSLLNKFHIKFEEGKLYEDNLFSFELILNSNYVCYLPYDLYMRRYRAESITTRKITYKDIEDISYIIRNYLQKFERVLKLGDVALFNSFIALIYKTYVFGKEKMSRERWDLECMNKLPKEISRMLLDVPLKYRSLTYYLFMYKINKSNEFIVYIQEGYRSFLYNSNIGNSKEGG